MPGTTPSMAAAALVPAALVLSRVDLDALLQSHITHRRAEPTAPAFLAHGLLVLQSSPTGAIALASAMAPGPPRPLPPRTRIDPTQPLRQGLVLVCIAADHAAAPQGDAAWEHWLFHHAPSFRLASTALDPAVVVLWMRMDGQGALVFRAGPQPLAWLSSGNAHMRWHPIPELHLAGGGMQRVQFHPSVPQPAANAPNHPAPDTEDTSFAAEGRLSRQRAALGPAAWSLLQRSHIAVVGVGRIGSVVAHGLVRMGVQRITAIEPDVMEPHNEDGDLAPQHEGRPKLEAFARFVRGLLRPGAELDARLLPVHSMATGLLLAQADVVLVCVDNDAARLWANAWALAHNRCLLVVATDIHGHGAEADLRLLPAGSGCLACVGGYAQADALLQQLAHEGPVPTPADFRQQRRGSLRSWSALVSNLSLRMLEQHLAREGGGAIFRHMAETAEGGLQVRDWRPASQLAPTAGARRCPFCTGLQGAGQGAVTAQRLQALAALWLAVRQGATPPNLASQR